TCDLIWFRAGDRWILCFACGAQTQDRPELGFKPPGQYEGVQRLKPVPQSSVLFVAQCSTGQSSLIRGLRLIMSAYPATALPVFGFQFHRRQKEVLQRTPDFFVEHVDRLPTA